MAHANVDSITMAVDPRNELLVTADTSGEIRTWLIEGFCDGNQEITDDKPRKCVLVKHKDCFYLRIYISPQWALEVSLLGLLAKIKCSICSYQFNI